jgi:hypothetical protein
MMYEVKELEIPSHTQTGAHLSGLLSRIKARRGPC